jgi:hypothetical protein
MVPVRAETRDRVRQGAVLALAIAQAVVTGLAGSRIQEQVDTGARSPVEPAAYAFSIWGLIFALCIAYGVWQARPTVAANPLLRQVGWPTAGAFLTIVGWSVVVPLGIFWLAQVFLLATWVFLALAAAGLAGEAGRRRLSAGERWFVALPLAPFFGWVTAANGVSLHGQAVDFRLVGADGPAGVLLGAALLVLAGLVAGVVVRQTRPAPPQFWAIYATTVLWAVVAIVVAQWGVEPIVVAAALLAAVPAVLAVIGNVDPSKPRGSSNLAGA